MKGKVDLAEQQAKLNTLMKSASLQTSSTATVDEKSQQKSKTRSKNLRAVPETYFEAHSHLKLSNKTSLDFSAYILEAIREKLERDGGLDK